MAMHLPGYDPGQRRRTDLATVREDIHLHVSAAKARAAVADPLAYAAWLTEAMSNYQADTERLRVDLALPGRREIISVRRTPSEEQREVAYRRDQGGAVEDLTWGLHSEGQSECHITIEVAYRPASGFFGGAAETLMHRPQRTQAIRDLLWNLKHDLEGPRPESDSDWDDEG